ncbi:MAG: hypothetical protein BroJett040_03190 [Oligoflexia bacterium]|nr:MAG: hypothetical protein BroJett040_03190 [Oligoflexia bacterium]
MYQNRHFYFNTIFLLLFTYICLGFQTNIWFSFTGNSPSPQLWLIITLYVTLYRKIYVSVFINYLIGIVLASFSSVSVGILWPALLIITVLAHFVKSRMFWPSTRYFVISTFSFSVLFHIIYFITSHLLENNPTRLSFFTRLSEILLTGLWAAPMYWALTWIDKISYREPLPDSTGVSE